MEADLICKEYRNRVQWPTEQCVVGIRMEEHMYSCLRPIWFAWEAMKEELKLDEAEHPQEIAVYDIGRFDWVEEELVRNETENFIAALYPQECYY
jgi:predicted AAA+ superfamily ATPase